ncbi:glutathione S-transferase family protein [Phenylobacterium sp.]|uniref:glutathione S-transferase family protein n=1 Tax=Phenylobacterium sp. TaxID=1871053 RepID=UPI002FDAC19C
MIFEKAQLMARPGRYRILAGPGSPYSHKVRAVMRYRRIAHDWTIPLGGFDGTGHVGGLGAFGKRMVPVVVYPDGAAWTDSTPIIHELEDLHDGPSVLPPSPAERFLARLIEDFADEWLAVILMAFRWTSEADVAFCARRQMSGWLGPVPEAELEAAINRFTARQQGVRNFIGGGDLATHAALQAEFMTLLEILEEMIPVQLFLFGQRPSIADFALYGMLSQFAIDPTPSGLMRTEAVRTYQWVQYVDDLSGHEGEWGGGSAPSHAVARLVELAGRGFRAMMTATAQAHAQGELRCEFDLAGQRFASIARPYTARCWTWLKVMFAELAPADREGLRPILEPAGFWEALKLSPGEAEAAGAMQKG